MRQESLLPHTDAIKKLTLEWTTYRGKQLVRYKDAAGYVHRTLTLDWAEAEAAFEKYRERMKVTEVDENDRSRTGGRA